MLEARLDAPVDDGRCQRTLHPGFTLELFRDEAEGYHQEYFERNGGQPYCQFVVAPKVAKFRKEFVDRLKSRREFRDVKVSPLLRAQIEEIVLHTYRVFECRDYARVDMRIDANGQPWILEVNANPDIAPDAGLARMARDRFPHAVILAGSEGAGKYTLAQMLAKAMNCLAPPPSDVLVDTPIDEGLELLEDGPLRRVELVLPEGRPHEEARQHRLADVHRVEHAAEVRVGEADADGDPLTYTWTQIGGPPVALSDPALAKPT